MIEDEKISRCYTVSIQDMLEIWIESFHHKDHLLVVWDARNDDGDDVSSGVYFYQIRSSNFNAVGKLVFVK